jgi:hypothetical protein
MPCRRLLRLCPELLDNAGDGDELNFEGIADDRFAGVEGKVLSVKVRRATIFVALTLYHWKALLQESFAAL